MKKYKLVKEEEGTLFRIIALRDFSDVKKGERGGLIQSEDNLSHEGDCWVYENAVISGDALVSENAVISGDALVSGNAVIFGYALVSENAVILGTAQVSGKARVFGNAVISGNAWVYDEAELTGDAWVYDEADLTGNARATKKVITFGNAFYYKITVSDNHIKIGCKQFLKSEWKNFTDDEITKMDGEHALKLWRLFKPLAEQMNLFD